MLPPKQALLNSKIGFSLVKSNSPLKLSMVFDEVCIVTSRYLTGVFLEQTDI